MKIHVLCLMVVLMLIGSTTAFAALTGVIAGKITDIDGNPIPGVTVTATGPNLPGARVDVTSNSGMYRMPELPPGTYTIRLEMMNMKTVERPDVRVSVNSTAIISLTMEMTPYEQTVVVTGSNDLLDIKSSTVKATIERDLTERLPGSDDLFSAFSMSGGITGTGNVRVHGGAATDNLYLFDGVDTTDPVTSTFGANLNADAIEQVEVQTGGFQAEYGRSMGGIVNAVTKSGGNDFHGVLRYKKMDSGTRADDKWSDYRVLGEYDYNDYTITFDGPVIRDKLWFMVSYNFYVQEGTASTIGFYGADPFDPDDLVTINADREYNLPYAKLTFQPSQQHKFVLNYSGEDAEIKNRTGNWDSDTPETYNTQVQGGPFYSLEWTWLKSSSLYFITRAGIALGILDNTPTDQKSDRPAFYDSYYMQNYNNSSSWTEEERNRMQLAFSANYYTDEMMGSHEFKSGIEYHDLTVDAYHASPGDALYIIRQVPMGDPDNPDFYTGSDATRTIYLNPGTSEARGLYYAFYLQDDWSPMENLTLNLGIRYETVKYENDDGETDVPAWTWGKFRADEYINPDGSYKQSAPMKFDNMLAPRIGVSWDVFGTGKTSVSAFYGRFYNPFDLQLPDLMFQPFSADTYAGRYQEYTGPEWSDRDRNGVPDEDFFFDDANWSTYQEDEPGDWNLIDPDIKAEYTDEIVIGVQHELIENFMVGLTYTYRETNDMVEDVGIFVDEDGNIVWTYLGAIKDDFSGLDPNRKYDPRDNGKDYAKHLYWVTNASGNQREYSGIELNARARKDNWDLQASYTYSKAEGAVTEGQPGYSGVAQFSGQYDTVQTSQNLRGELPWSARHHLKLAGSYHFDLTDWYEMSFGINSYLMSGYHYSKRSAPNYTYDPDNPSNDINDPSTWTGRPPYRSYSWFYPEGRGGYELPSYYSIDVSWQNTFKFGKFGAATVIFDIENITDNQSITNEADVYNPNKPALFGQQNEWGSPREYRLSLKYSF